MTYSTENTVQSIIDALAGMAARKETVGPQMWMDGALKATVMLQSEQDLAVDLQLALNKVKARYMEEGKSAAYAVAMMEALDEWAVSEKQKNLITTVKDFNMLAKKNAQLESDLLRGTNY